MDVINADLIKLLEELREISEIEGETYREKAYRRAATAVRRLGRRIDADFMPDTRKNKIAGIGAGIAAKIAEYVRTGRIAELDALRASPTVRSYRTLGGIVGVGPATLRQWTSIGISDLASLRRAVAHGAVELTHAQKLGLKYYTDLNTQIPRAEVAELGAVIHGRLAAICHGIRFEISGSYRRGRATSGDIDIIMTSDNWQRDLLARFRAAAAADDPAYVDTLSAGEQRLTFLYRGPASGRVRQIDLLWIPPAQFVPAVLYFTGSGSFNEYMRGVAKRRGYRLNQTGLYRVGPRGALAAVPVSSERDIFAALEIPYRTPEQRDIT